MLKYGTNKGLTWYFWARILKNYCDFLNEHSQIFLVAKCRKKTETPKFGTQNALFWYFLRQNFKTLLSYLKSAPSHFSSCRIL